MEIIQAGTMWGRKDSNYLRLHVFVNYSASHNQVQIVPPREGVSTEDIPLGTHPWPRDYSGLSELVPILSSRNHPLSRTFALQGLIFHSYKIPMHQIPTWHLSTSGTSKFTPWRTAGLGVKEGLLCQAAGGLRDGRGKGSAQVSKDTKT